MYTFLDDSNLICDFNCFIPPNSAVDVATAFATYTGGGPGLDSVCNSVSKLSTKVFNQSWVV